MSNDLEDISTIVNELFQRSTDREEEKYVKLYIESICWNGTWAFYVSLDTKISQIKLMALSELDLEKFENRASLYSLIFPNAQRVLNDNKTVAEEVLEDDSELELIRIPSSQEIVLRFAQHITDSSINLATEKLATPVEKKEICNVCLDIQPPEFMSDVRKIMVTLIEYSLRLMLSKPNAKAIFDVVRRKLMCENFFVNSGVIQQYEHLGVTERRIRFAVNASFNDPFSVTEWLLELKETDSDHLSLPKDFEVASGVSKDVELREILELFRLYMRASFKLCTKATDKLIEMGFKEDEIKHALRYTGNNLPEALEYLIGNRDPSKDGAKPGLAVGLSPTSDMYKAIISEAAIILPMSDPSVLYACLSIVDANSFLVSSMRFPSLMNLLNKILATYYLTRCNLAMQQMIGNIPHD